MGRFLSMAKLFREVEVKAGAALFGPLQVKTSRGSFQVTQWEYCDGALCLLVAEGMQDAAPHDIATPTEPKDAKC